MVQKWSWFIANLYKMAAQSFLLEGLTPFDYDNSDAEDSDIDDSDEEGESGSEI